MQFMKPSVFGVLALLFLLDQTNRAHAQGTTQTSAELELTDLLKVRAVTGARHDQRLVDSPRQIAVVTAEEIRRRNYRSTPDALADIVGVFVQETNDGGGSPIIRGLVGNQILILVDGIRLNNSAYRLGPNQYPEHDRSQPGRADRSRARRRLGALRQRRARRRRQHHHAAAGREARYGRRSARAGSRGCRRPTPARSAGAKSRLRPAPWVS